MKLRSALASPNSLTGAVLALLVLCSVGSAKAGGLELILPPANCDEIPKGSQPIVQTQNFSAHVKEGVDFLGQTADFYYECQLLNLTQIVLLTVGNAEEVDRFLDQLDAIPDQTDHGYRPVHLDPKLQYFLMHRVMVAIGFESALGLPLMDWDWDRLRQWGAEIEHAEASFASAFVQPQIRYVLSSAIEMPNDHWRLIMVAGQIRNRPDVPERALVRFKSD